MQADQITLAVDVANNASLVNKVFNRIEDPVGRSIYFGVTDAHTPALRNTLNFYRTYPKRSGLFLGSTKTAVKFTRDVAVPNAEGSGNIVTPIIIEVTFSVPVGTPTATLLALRQHVVAIVDRDDICGKLNELGEV